MNAIADLAVRPGNAWRARSRIEPSIRQLAYAYARNRGSSPSALGSAARPASRCRAAIAPVQRSGQCAGRAGLLRPLTTPSGRIRRWFTSPRPGNRSTHLRTGGTTMSVCCRTVERSRMAAMAEDQRDRGLSLGRLASCCRMSSASESKSSSSLPAWLVSQPMLAWAMRARCPEQQQARQPLAAACWYRHVERFVHGG